MSRLMDQMLPSKKSSNPDMSTLLWVCGAGVIVLVLSLCLWMLARPSDARLQMAQLQTKAQALSQAQSGPGDLSLYPVGSVCTGDVESIVSAPVKSALMNLGFKLDSLDVDDGLPLGNPALTAYHFTLKGTGSYEAAITTLDRLDHFKPKLFLETMALKNHVSDVELIVEGRVFCRHH